MRDLQPIICQLVIIWTIVIINGGCNSILPAKTVTIANRDLTHLESPNWQSQLTKVEEIEIYLAQRQEQLANEMAERIANLAERKIELASILAEKKIAAKEQELLSKPNQSMKNIFQPQAESRLDNFPMASPTTTKLISPTLTGQVTKDLIRPTKTGFIFTLGDSSFVTNQVELTTDAHHYLSNMAVLLQKSPTHPILITNYVDSTEPQLELLQRRVNIIRQTLVNFGVNPRRIISHSKKKNSVNRVETTQSDCQAHHCIEIMLFNGTI
jgi:outer membrane protein OmpA-like peptidoglycan-associated protein